MIPIILLTNLKFMTYAEIFRRSKIKFSNQWHRLGLRKSWIIFIPISILIPIVSVAEFTLYGCLFGLAGIIFIYFRFLRKR